MDYDPEEAATRRRKRETLEREIIFDTSVDSPATDHWALAGIIQDLEERLAALEARLPALPAEARP